MTFDSCCSSNSLQRLLFICPLVIRNFKLRSPRILLLGRRNCSYRLLPDYQFRIWGRLVFSIRVNPDTFWNNFLFWSRGRLSSILKQGMSEFHSNKLRCINQKSNDYPMFWFIGVVGLFTIFFVFRKSYRLLRNGRRIFNILLSTNSCNQIKETNKLI